MRVYRCTIRASHKCDKNYKSEYKLTRHIAAYKAAQKKGRNRKIGYLKHVVIRQT